MINVAIFASGSGSNFEHIVMRNKEGKMKHANIKLLIVDKEKAYVIERAKRLSIPYIYVNPKGYANKQEYEKEILKHLKQFDIELIALAGYMRIISPILLQAYPQRIINLHPAYLPNFPGKQSILDAYEAKVEETGVTIHYIDEGIDTGEIIYQEKLTIDASWDLAILEDHVRDIEYRIYPKILEEVCMKMEGNKNEKSID